MRRLLYEAASTLIRPVKRYSPLKSWAVRLAARRSFKGRRSDRPEARRAPVDALENRRRIPLDQGGRYLI